VVAALAALAAPLTASGKNIGENSTAAFKLASSVAASQTYFIFFVLSAYPLTPLRRFALRREAEAVKAASRRLAFSAEAEKEARKGALFNGERDRGNDMWNGRSAEPFMRMLFAGSLLKVDVLFITPGWLGFH
jgi:hypothetical protein